LALLSDFFKDITLDAEAIRFLGIGSLLIATNITMAVLMFQTYLRNEHGQAVVG
jgi:Kef-type K+ transport system membrane component KefB